MRIRGLLALAAAAVLAAGCGTQSSLPRRPVVDPKPAPAQPGPARPAAVSAADAAALRDGESALAGRLLALIARTQPTAVLSPASISQALAMTYAGARGETATQLATALDFRLPAPQLGAALHAVEASLARVNGPSVTLDIADTLYGQRGEDFRSPFLSLLRRDYGADLHTVDFAGQAAAAVAAINAWVSQHTAAKIPHLLDASDILPLTKLVLVDAVYLNARWLEPFDPNQTSLAPFHAPGGTMQVQTMHQAASLPYRQAAGYQALELPYQGGRLAFDVLLPNPGRLPSLLARLSAQGPLQLLGGLRQTRLGLALPKFTLTTRFELAHALESLGMRLAFQPGLADLSGIAGQPGDLYINAVVHEAYLSVNEKGTQAAAATGVSVSSSAAELPPPIQVVVNRPFVFVLRDVKTGAVLFTGLVSRP